MLRLPPPVHRQGSSSRACSEWRSSNLSLSRSNILAFLNNVLCNSGAFAVARVQTGGKLFVGGCMVVALTANKAVGCVPKLVPAGCYRNAEGVCVATNICRDVKGRSM